MPKLSNSAISNDLEWRTPNQYFKVKNQDIIQRQITRTVQDRASLPTNRKSYNGLSNGAIFNDLEQPLTLFSRSHYNFTLNNSQTVKDTAIITMEGE